MRFLVRVSSFFVAMGLASCTSQNPLRCCVTEHECAELGYTFPTRCDDGRVCSATQCVEPVCSRPSDCTDPNLPVCVEGMCQACDMVSYEGCSTGAPVCQAGTSCVGCSVDDDCSRHEGVPVCAETGACVQCAMTADCTNPTPICDGNACRSCSRDQECPTGVCDDDGTCVADAEIVFASPTGSDSGQCTRDLPCSSIEYSIDQTTSTRTHVLFAPGSYVPIGGAFAPTLTNRILHLHGYGATIQSMFPVTAEGRSVFYMSGGTLTLKGLSIQHSIDANGSALRCVNGGQLRLEDVTIATPYSNIRSNTCGVTAIRSSFKLNGTRGPHAIDIESGQFVMEQSSSSDGGIRSSAGTITIRNCLITKEGLSIGTSTGTVEFSTIANTQLDSGAARAAECASAAPDRVEFVHNVIWSPSNTAPVMISGCRTRENIIGPITQTGEGNVNEDPRFIQAGANFHIGVGSPAVDKSNSGPANDFDGDMRPSGAAFDWGYDELSQ